MLRFDKALGTLERCGEETGQGRWPSRDALRQGKLLHVLLVAGLDVDLKRVEDADDGVVVGDDDRQFDEEFGVQVTA